jgi:hypothetical protein
LYNIPSLSFVQKRSYMIFVRNIYYKLHFTLTKKVIKDHKKIQNAIEIFEIHSTFKFRKNIGIYEEFHFHWISLFYMLNIVVNYDFKIEYKFLFSFEYSNFNNVQDEEHF